MGTAPEKMTGCEIMNRRPHSETAAALDHNFYGEDLDKKGIRDLLLTITVKLIISKATPNAEAIEDHFMEVLITNLSSTGMIRLTSESKRQQLSLVLVVYPDRSGQVDSPYTS